MKSSALLAPGLFPSGLDGRGCLEMFVAIIICLRGHRYKRNPAHTSSSSSFSSSSSSFPYKSCSPSLISLFCLSVFLARFPTCLARASFRSFCLSANVRWIVRLSARPYGKTEKILEQFGSPRGQKGEGHEDSERTCPKAYAPEARDKQERGKELVLKIVSVT